MPASPISTIALTRRRALALVAAGASGAGLLAVRPGTRAVAALAVAQDADPIRVTTTIAQLADAVGNIGGDRVDVTALMGPGVDPHLYSPSSSDIGLLGEADMVAYVGINLEGRMIDVLEQLPQLDVPAVAVGEAVPEDTLLFPDPDDDNPDPHIWFSVPRWSIAVEALRDAMIEQFPDDIEIFETNAAAYLEELETLDAYIREQTGTVPEEQRVLITAHDAFGYFGVEYGYEVFGIQGLSTASEAGAGDIQDLADMIAERQIPAIFVESSVSPSTIEALREAVLSRDWEVVIGGSLYSDAMGDEGTPEGTYIGMVTHNIDTITAALRGADTE